LFARHKDGYRIPVYVRSIPLEDAGGSIIAIAELFQQQGSQSELRWAGDSGAHTQDGLNGPSPIASETLLSALAQEIGKLPNRVIVQYLDGELGKLVKEERRPENNPSAENDPAEASEGTRITRSRALHYQNFVN
jgi:hypothetical protein